MKRNYRKLLLIICIFFIAYALAEESQCCSDKAVYAFHKERRVVKLNDIKRADGISQTIRARSVHGGDTNVKPNGKKNIAMASMAKSASLVLLHVTTITLVHLFFY